MTTIAYRDGVLASDSRLTQGEWIWTDKGKKITRLRDGTLFGSSGDHEGSLILEAALKEGNLFPELPEDSKDVHAIRVTPDGKVWFFEGYKWDRVPEGFVAIGSGRQAAMAILRYGGSAVDAVKAGIASDVFSGGKVQTVRLRKHERSRDKAKTNNRRHAPKEHRAEDTRNASEDRKASGATEQTTLKA